MSDNEECFSNKLVLTVVTASLGATNLFMLLLLGMMFIKYRKAAEPKRVSTKETPNKDRLHFLRNASNMCFFLKSLICQYYQSRSNKGLSIKVRNLWCYLWGLIVHKVICKVDF